MAERAPLPALPRWLPLLADHAPDQPLAWAGGRPITAARFVADAAALAARLPAQGAVINLCLDRYAFAVALGAALQRGLPSLLPPNARPDTLAQLHRPHAGRLVAVADDAGLQVDGLEILPIAAAAGTGPLPREAAAPKVARDDASVCLLTSGSTGAPQPHAKSWGLLTVNIRAEAQRLAEHLGLATLRGLTLVATVPAQHSYGLESSVLLALIGGAAFEAGRPFYPADIAQALASVPRPRGLVTTPFHLKALLQANLPLPEVDLVLCATAPLSPQLARQAEGQMRARLVEIYGCTEAGQIATRRTAATEQWHTFGALRIEARTDDGEETFVVQGGHVEQPTPLSDVLRLDDASHFRLLGRANDLVNVAGKRSSLGHLNYHLNSIDGVEDGAFWLPDDVPDGVVRPVAFVVAPRLGAAAIVRALRQRLEPVFVPRRVVHVPALPRESTGKITTRALREFALRHLGSPAGDAPASAASSQR